MPSKKVLEAKQKIVADMAAEFSKAQSIVFADYRGLTVAEDTRMRTAMRQAGVTYQVVKNSLTLRALQQAGIKGADEHLVGPTAVVYSKDELIAPARIIKKFEKEFKLLEIKGGIVEGEPVSKEEITSLALIPEPEVLYGQLVFSLLSPITKLAIVLDAIKDEKTNADTKEPVAVAASAENTADSE